MHQKQSLLTKRESEKGIKRRMSVIFLAFGLAIGVLGYRGIRLHTSHDDKLATLANRQYTEKVHALPIRGNIYDRRGFELAVSVSTSSLAAHPHLISDPGQLAKQLAPILGVKQSTLKKKLTSDKKFVWIKRRLMPETAQQIEALDESALSLEKEARRYYPNRELASQVLGAAGLDGEGLGGLELIYDDYLRGSAERDVAYRDARGEVFADTSASDDHSLAHLHLNIDRNIQYTAETELATAAHRLQARRGSVVVMDPQTGAILAMASYPRFNPNTYGEYDLSRWRNVAITDTFEPGSVFKIITAAAAIEEGLIDLEDRIYCENGALRIGRTEINDHEKYGDLTLSEIIKYSSNIGTAKIAHAVGKDKLYEMIQRFGFGETSDIDYPGEATGKVRDHTNWHPVDTAAISFGQGLTTTALQITNLYATIANGGRRMKPFLAHQISKSDGDIVREFKASSLGQIIRPETAKILSDLLTGVTEEGGTGTAAAIHGFKVAGKTGTSQQYDPKTKSYSKTDYYASFVGFAPADDPRLVVYVGIDRPQGAHYGGEVAAPIFRNIMSAALYQLRIPPAQTALPLEISNEPKEIIKPAPLTSASVAPKEQAMVVPDFSGLSIRQVLALGQGRGLTVDVEGSGKAFRQDPPPGHLLKKGELCRVYFRPLS